MNRSIHLLFAATAIMLCLAACNSNVDIDQLKPEDAIEYLDAQIKKHPNDANLLYQRGKTLIQLGKEKNHTQYFKEAIHDLEAAIKIDDSRVEYYTALGDAHFSIGNVGDSYSALQKALKLDENNLEACLKMGEISFYSKDYDRAIESLNKVTEQDNTNQTALFMKGFIYKENKDTANAVFYFRKLIDLYPEYEPAYEELGMLYAQFRNKLGLEYLNTALTLQPDNTSVLWGLAQLYHDTEDAEKANEYYVRILEIDPNNQYAWFNRGRIEMELYLDFENAIDFFQKAIECDQQFAEAYHNIGVCFEELGNGAKAQEYYNQAKALGYKAETK